MDTQTKITLNFPWFLLILIVISSTFAFLHLCGEYIVSYRLASDEPILRMFFGYIAYFLVFRGIHIAGLIWGFSEIFIWRKAKPIYLEYAYVIIVSIALAYILGYDMSVTIKYRLERILIIYPLSAVTGYLVYRRILSKRRD